MVRQPVIVGAVAAAGTLGLAVVDADATSVPLCPFKAVSGLDCPFCGCLRAVSALTRFDLVEAMDHNVVFTASVPFLVLGWGAWLWASRSPSPVPRRFPPWVTVAAVVMLFTFTVARNVPRYSWLASGA